MEVGSNLHQELVGPGQSFTQEEAHCPCKIMQDQTDETVKEAEAQVLFLREFETVKNYELRLFPLKVVCLMASAASLRCSEEESQCHEINEEAMADTSSISATISSVTKEHCR